jgi:Uma2 family endonuclease
MDDEARKRRTYDDYLAIEAETGVRHEFVDGVAYAMSGGTYRHSRLKSRLVGEFDRQLRGSGCEVSDSDFRIRALGTPFASYPDLSVICGDLQTPPGDAHSAVNPVLLIEVLSDSTEAWDRGEKFNRCQQIESLQHYVLVSTATERIEHFQRTSAGVWELRTYGLGDTLRIEHPAVEVDVSDLYDGMPAYEPLKSARRPAE